MTVQERNKAAQERANRDPEAVADAAAKSQTVSTALKSWLDSEPNPIFEEFGKPVPPNVMAARRLGFLQTLHRHPEEGQAYQLFTSQSNARTICEALAELPTGPEATDGLSLLAIVTEAMPRPVKRNDREDRILPARVAVVHSTDSRAGRLFVPSSGFATDESGRELVLPGFEHLARTGPALPLQLYDLGVAMIAERRGAGAPMALRLWVEGVLSVPLLERLGMQPVAMEVTLRELLAKLYPGKRRPRPNEYWPRMMAAVEALDSHEARIPWQDPKTGRGGLRRVVSVSDIPRGPGALDDIVRLIVDLPPGARDGPVMPASLPLWGVRRAAPYRALIGLGFRWHEPGRTRFPVGHGKRRYWLQSRNPRDYKPLTDADVVDLCFPTSGRARRTNLVSEAWKVIRELAEADELVLTADGRALPPQG